MGGGGSSSEPPRCVNPCPCWASDVQSVTPGVDPAATGGELVDALKAVSPGGLEAWALGYPEAVPASPHQCLEPAAESVLLPDTSRPSPQPPRPPATRTQGGLRKASSEPEFLLRCD